MLSPILPHHVGFRPIGLDPERHKFNSDKSELTITPVKPEDNGEYICTAKNKIGEATATAFLDVSGMACALNGADASCSDTSFRT